MKECFLNTQRVLALSDERSPKWSEWSDIEEKPDYEGRGVYKVRLVDPRGFPVSVPRFFDTDKEGILQICYSDSIKRGIYRFRRTTEGKNYAHAEGKRLRLLKKYSNFEEKFRGCRLQYSFKKEPDRREGRVEQERLLKQYVKKYGELPPNKNSFQDKHIDWENLRNFDSARPIILPGFMTEVSSNS